MSSDLRTEVRTTPPAVVIDLFGDVTAAADAELTTAYDHAAEQNLPIVLNFQQASYINSAGIAIILSLLNQSRRTDRVMVISGLSSHYRKIFQMVGLDQFTSIYDDESAALAAV